MQLVGTSQFHFFSYNCLTDYEVNCIELQHKLDSINNEWLQLSLQSIFETSGMGDAISSLARRKATVVHSYFNDLYNLRKYSYLTYRAILSIFAQKEIPSVFNGTYSLLSVLKTADRDNFQPPKGL